MKSPVYHVIAVPLEKVRANAYNPNAVAPPEMKLLERSIWEDGFTMPVVCYYRQEEDVYEIVDGFHRYTVLKTSVRIREREGGMPEYHFMVPPLTAASEPQRKLLDDLNAAYRKGTGLEPGREPSNPLVVDALTGLLIPDAIDQIEAFLTDKPYLFDRIRERHRQRCFFRQPAVLLIYFLADRMPSQTRDLWPIESKDLALVSSDLGVAFQVFKETKTAKASADLLHDGSELGRTCEKRGRLSGSVRSEKRYPCCGHATCLPHSSNADPLAPPRIFGM